MPRNYATPVEQRLRDLANERVAKALNGIWNAFGPALARDELAAMMDGAQDAVAEWMPPVSASAAARARVAAKMAEADAAYEARQRR